MELYLEDSSSSTVFVAAALFCHICVVRYVYIYVYVCVCVCFSLFFCFCFAVEPVLDTLSEDGAGQLWMLTKACSRAQTQGTQSASHYSASDADGQKQRLWRWRTVAGDAGAPLALLVLGARVDCL